MFTYNLKGVYFQLVNYALKCPVIYSTAVRVSSSVFAQLHASIFCACHTHTRSHACVCVCVFVCLSIRSGAE